MKKKIIICISIAVVIIGIVIGLVILNNPKKVIVKSITEYTLGRTESHGSLIYTNGNVYKFNGNKKEKKTTIPPEELTQIKEYIKQTENKTEYHEYKSHWHSENPNITTISIYQNNQPIILYSGSDVGITKNTSECTDALEALINKYIY